MSTGQERMKRLTRRENTELRNLNLQWLFGGGLTSAKTKRRNSLHRRAVSTGKKLYELAPDPGTYELVKFEGPDSDGEYQIIVRSDENVVACVSLDWRQVKRLIKGLASVSDGKTR